MRMKRSRDEIEEEFVTYLKMLFNGHYCATTFMKVMDMCFDLFERAKEERHTIQEVLCFYGFEKEAQISLSHKICQHIGRGADAAKSVLRATNFMPRFWIAIRRHEVVCGDELIKLYFS